VVLWSGKRRRKGRGKGLTYRWGVLEVLFLCCAGFDKPLLPGDIRLDLEERLEMAELVFEAARGISGSVYVGVGVSLALVVFCEEQV